MTKAPVSKPRMVLGKNGGGSVRLAPLGENGVLALCEGIETGLAVTKAVRGSPSGQRCRRQAWSKCNFQRRPSASSF
jgi:hypothetical protein